MSPTNTLRSVTFATSIAFVLGAALTGCPAMDPEEATMSERPATRDGGVTADSGPTGGDSGSSARRAGEVCGNGLDDDHNGQIDDGCACLPNQTQTCSPLDEAHAGVGQCAWGRQTCVGEELGTWGSCVGAGMPSTEVCDGVDNNCDGRIDEGCTCTVGQTRPCYTGPSGTENVGTCHAGTETCVATNGTAAWGACSNEVTPSAETCDHADHNCNGTDDDGCYCPGGQTPVFVRPPTGYGSGILPPGSTLFNMVCEDSPCAAGQAGVANDPTSPASIQCVPLPPHCADGEQLDFVSGSLQCVPCQVIVQFGALYGNQRVCTSIPTLMCPSGQTPTFVYETRTWECRTTCNNGQYDQHTLDGMLVCVPC